MVVVVVVVAEVGGETITAVTIVIALQLLLL